LFLLAADLEGEAWPVRVPHVDHQAIPCVNGVHLMTVDEDAVKAAAVDGDPAALVEAHHQVDAGDQPVDDADIGAQVAPDDNITAGCKSAS
jgi:hypothetical protein